MNSSLFNEGIVLMFLGMGFVFFFLMFLVGAMKTLSSIVSKFVVEEVKTPITKNFSPAKDSDEDEIVAVIASVLHHRKLS